MANTVNPLSLSTLFINLKYDDIKLAVGTAFLYKHEDNLYLASNWHNYSGRNPATQKPINRDCATPNNVEIHGFRSINGNIEEFHSTHSLRDEDDYSIWLEDPEHGSQVDVALLPIDLDPKYEYFHIEKAIHLTDPHDSGNVLVADSVFVLGYPFGLKLQGNLPIWKEATIASEPEIDCDGLPLLYIDTATREGMSGSPVIMYRKRPLRLVGENASSHNAEFIGVYSGRVIPKDLVEVQLGKVWKKKVLKKIINGNKHNYA